MSELETVRSLARAALASLEANRQRIDDLNVYPVPDGDTGTNLTLTVRGVVDALADSTAIARAFRSAADAAYAAVRKPAEGTMLTVIRELAEEAEGRSSEPPAELLEALVRRGEDAVARTPEQLDVLREAGVVDAGAAGLLELVRGIAAAVAGKELPQPAAPSELPQEALHLEPSQYRYCTTFVIEGDDLDAASLEPELE